MSVPIEEVYQTTAVTKFLTYPPIKGVAV